MTTIITTLLLVLVVNSHVYAEPYNEKCLSDKQALCLSPEKEISPNITDSNNQFNVLSYNIFDRPYIISHDGQVERSCRIPAQIAKQVASNDNVDAIVIQEAFTKGCRPGAELRSLLAFYGFPHSTATLDKSSSLSNGGVFIASKWPIALSQQQVFSNCSGSDCLAAKGVVYARIHKKVAGQHAATSYHIFGTHFNAWDGEEQAKLRLKQAKQVQAFIDKQHIPNTEAVIIAGDLNINSLGNKFSQSEVTQVLATMHAVMPEITGDQHSTIDPIHNPLAFESGSHPLWLDYVLYSTQHLKPVVSSMQSIVLQTAKPFKVCMKAILQPYYVYPDSRWCSKTMKLIDLSDHYPVLGQFKYKSRELGSID